MSYYVYIIQSGRFGAYKIGMSKNIERRIETLQIGNPEKLYKIAAIDFQTIGRAKMVESQLHKMYSRARIRGEWFNSTIELKRADHFFNTHFREDLPWREQQKAFQDGNKLELSEMKIVREAESRI